jgi:hypothetical protein
VDRFDREGMVMLAKERLRRLWSAMGCFAGASSGRAAPGGSAWDIMKWRRSYPAGRKGVLSWMGTLLVVVVWLSLAWRQSAKRDRSANQASRTAARVAGERASLVEAFRQRGEELY